MSEKLYWLFGFVGCYWAYCLFWGAKGAKSSKTAAGYFIAGRSLGIWVFILAATATSFSGWTFVGHPGKILTDGLPYAYASFYALTIPLTGIFFLRRQWILGKAFSYFTPGEMYSDYFKGNGIRILTVLVAFLFSVPYLGVQLRASGALFNVLTDGQIGVITGMFALTSVMVIYVAAGGLKSVAFVDCAQAILLALGIVVLGGVAVNYVGGWTAFTDGLAELVKADISAGANLTPDGFSKKVAMPGVIQWVSSGSQSIGGVWTGVMCMTYMFALMGIQASPAFTMWSFANKTAEGFRWQQVVASGLIVGIILFSFTIFQGLAGEILVKAGVWESVSDKTLVPQLINLLSDTAPWLVGLLAVCALAAMQSTGAAYMSTFSGMITRDVYRHFVNRDASEEMQKTVGRVFVVVISLSALIVAAESTSALVMLGGLAVAYGFQMYPALMATLYFPVFTKKGVYWGLIAGLVTVTLTDKIAGVFPLPWGAYPLTMHSAGWGIIANLIVAFFVSKFSNEDNEIIEFRKKRHLMLKELAGVPEAKRKYIPLAVGMTIVWFMFGFGPFAYMGNTIFSDPNQPSTWIFGMPSIWIWQICFLVFGVFVMWFLAFFMELSMPVSSEKIEKISKKYFT